MQKLVQYNAKHQETHVQIHLVYECELKIFFGNPKILWDPWPDIFSKRLISYQDQGAVVSKAFSLNGG